MPVVQVFEEVDLGLGNAVVTSGLLPTGDAAHQSGNETKAYKLIAIGADPPSMLNRAITSEFESLAPNPLTA
jgi:hypothetical protein